MRPLSVMGPALQLLFPDLVNDAAASAPGPATTSAPLGASCLGGAASLSSPAWEGMGPGALLIKLLSLLPTSAA